MSSHADSLPRLYPIVIPPLGYSSPSGGKAYACAGEGLIWDGHKFDPNVQSSIPLLEPVRTKTGKVAVRQPHIPKKPAAWWKAQCKFRGLSQQGKIEVLQERLRDTDQGMVGDLAIAEKSLNEEFRKKNAAAREKTLETNREATRARQRAQEVDEERPRKKPQAVVPKAKKELTSSSSPKDSKGKDKKWNIAGSYDIKCPYVEEQWGGDGQECSLNIHITREGSESYQMWAVFDFIALEGIFRFVNPNHDSTNAPPAGRDRGGGGHGVYYSEYDEDDEDDDNDVDPSEFLIPATHNPSASNRTWSFRWRGSETGEGEIQLYSDEELCSLTFRGARGTEIEGEFESGLTGKIGFSGKKVKEEGMVMKGAKARWSDYSEKAHEYARTARWR